MERSLGLVKEPRLATVLFTFGHDGKVRRIDSYIACATINLGSPSHFFGV